MSARLNPFAQPNYWIKTLTQYLQSAELEVQERYYTEEVPGGNTVQTVSLILYTCISRDFV